MDILILTLGYAFLWHVLLYRFLPFLSEYMRSEDGGSIFIFLFALLPFVLLVSLIFVKYGPFVALSSLALSVFVVFFCFRPLSNWFDKIRFHPSVHFAYNVIYTTLLFLFFYSLIL